MPTRVRSIVGDHPWLNYDKINGWVERHQSVSTASMTDTTGPKPWPEREMTRTESKTLGSTTNRPSLFGGSAGDIGYPSVLVTSASSSSQFDPDESFPTLPVLTTALMAATNPGNPSMNLPLYMLELRDIPQMIRHAGNLLHKIRKSGFLIPNAHKEAAAATLAYQFGWAPLIKDLISMLDFGLYVDRRMNSIRKLNSGKGDKRRATIFRGGNNKTVTLSTLVAAAPNIPGSVECTRTDTASGVVTWKLRPGQPFIPSSRFEAVKLALGLNSGNIPLTVWNSIPWTWLIDWFTGVSTFLKATANSWLFMPVKAVIVKKSVIGATHPDLPVGINPPQLSKGVRTKTYYKRTPVAPIATINLRVPILDAFKMSILGSLLITRLSR